MINDDNDSSNSTASSTEYPQYRGPTKLVWEDGQQVIRPDFEAAANGTPGALQESFSSVANKTLDDVVSAADEIQFSQLKNDDQKYDRIVNLVSGVDHPSQLFTSRYVQGDPRDLKDILKDLIDQKKIYLNQKDGNIYRYDLAIERHMISFKCPYCSKVLFSEDERSKHAIHTHMSQQRVY
jgi:hypothetical protein